MKQTRKPKAKARVRHLKSGQPVDVRSGRFMAKPGKATKPIQAGQSVMEILGQRADAQRLARVIERRAYAGDTAAVELLSHALETHRQQRGSEPGMTLEGIRRLGTPAQALLVELLGIAAGEAAPSVEERLRTVSTYIFALKGFEGVAVAAALERALKELTSPSPETEPPAEAEQPAPTEAVTPPAQQQKRVAKGPEAKPQGNVVEIGVNLPERDSLWRKSPWRLDYPDPA